MNFFRSAWLAVSIMFCAFTVAAQVAVELSLNQEKYMQYEPIYAKIRLRNYSGRPLVFGKDDSLQGEVQLEITQNRRIIKPLSLKDFALTGTVLLPGQSEEFVFRVDRYYKMTRTGQYNIHAFVKHKQLGSVFRSAERFIEVSAGVELWRRSVGVPDVLAGSRDNSKSSSVSQMRSFSLRVLEERSVRCYYVVVEDAGKVYGVIRAGREISSAPRSLEVDMLNRLHIITPVAPRLFRYMVINLDGRIEQQDFIKRDKSVPMLVRDRRSGEVSRVGGVEAVPGVDYKMPEPKKGSR